MRIELSLTGAGAVAPTFVDLAFAAQCSAGEIAFETAQQNTVCQPCLRGEYEKSGSCSAAPSDIKLSTKCNEGSTVSWCESCPTGVVCEEGSAVSDFKLMAGNWRTDEDSEDVRKCRFGVTSCPGAGKNQASVSSPSQRRTTSSNATGPDPYCSANHVGHLCSACAPDFFLSWTGDGKCYECATKESHAPTIGLMSGVFVIMVSCLACAYKKSLKKAQGITTATPKSTKSLFSKASQVYTLAKFKVFTLFLTSQVRLRSQTFR